MVDITGVLSLSHFRLTNIKVLSLLFTEYSFLLPSHAGNTLLIGFMFYQCLLGVVTYKDAMRQEYSWFAHAIIKNQTRKLSILLNFYFQGSRFKFILHYSS